MSDLSLQELRQLCPLGNRVLLFLDVIMLLRTHSGDSASKRFGKALSSRRIRDLLSGGCYGLCHKDFTRMHQDRGLGDAEVSWRSWGADIAIRRMLFDNIQKLGNISFDMTVLWEHGFLSKMGQLHSSQDRQEEAIAQAIIRLYSEIIEGRLTEKDFQEADKDQVA